MIETLLAAVTTCLAVLTFLLHSAQRRLEEREALAAWSRDVKEWASHVIDAMAAAEESGGHAEIQARTEHAARLSALIDHGRLLVPNEESTGYRHPILDTPMAAYRVLTGRLDWASAGYSSLKEALWCVRREFVDTAQKHCKAREVYVHALQLSEDSPSRDSGVRAAEALRRALRHQPRNGGWKTSAA